MSTPIAFPDPDEVLGQLDWVRRLAQKLVGNPAEAEDLSQEVWLLSQRLHRPGHFALRKWLSGILRNVIRDRRRAAQTRSEHETRSAMERVQATNTPDVVRELSIHQVVVERLMQLRDPYRSTLLARYFEDLSHGEIAERDQVSIATVRSRLQRGLSQLRSDLGQKQQGQASVLALLALQTWNPERLTPQPLPLSTWIAWATAVVVVAGTALFLRTENANSPRVADLSPVEERSAPEVGDVRESAGSPQKLQPERQALSSAEVDSIPPEVAVSALGVVQVEVIDLEERPIANVEVAFLRFMPDGSKVLGEPALSDSKGRAKLAGIEGRGYVLCPTTDQVQLGYPNADENFEGETIAVVLVPSTILQGKALEEDGTPLSDVFVKVAFLNDFEGSIGKHLAHANHPQFESHTDAEGEFQIRVPHCAQPMGLLAKRIGFEDEKLPWLVVDREPAPLEITMRTIEDPNTCFGIVRSSEGEAVAGAWVADGEHVVRTNEAGSFQLGLVSKDADLWVGAPDYAPRRIPRNDDLRGITLELSGSPLTIEGQVTYRDGTPAVGLQIRLRNEQPVGTYFFNYGGRRAYTSMTAEAFAVPDERTVPGRPRRTTDAEGRFLVGGLLPRDYEIDLVDPKTLQRIEGLFFPAGSLGVRIEAPERPEPVSGTLKTPSGEPLAGVLVRSMERFEERPGPQTRTDAQGRFEFEHLAVGCRLWAEAKLPWVHVGSVIEGTRSLALEVEPGARLSLTIDLREGFAGQPPKPTLLYFRDAAGERVPFVPDDIRLYRKEELAIRPDSDGIARPVPLLVPARAHELVFSNERPLLIHPLSLQPGEEVSIAE